MFRDLQELAPRIYLYPIDDTQPNIGVLKLSQQTLLIDAGNSPRHARMIMASMAGGSFPPIDTLIYTHHHWDHTFAASTYNPVQVIAHEKNAVYMAQYAAREWNNFQLREESRRNPRVEARNHRMIEAVREWYDFRVVEPNLLFSSSMSLHFDEDNLSLELLHMPGSRHADDSLVVKIPQAGIIFLGDCYYPPPYHLRPPQGDDDLNIPMLEALAAEAYELYIDGHGTPRSLSQFQQMIEQEKARQNVT